MNPFPPPPPSPPSDPEDGSVPVDFDFAFTFEPPPGSESYGSRRRFFQTLGAGLLVGVPILDAVAQNRPAGRRGGAADTPISARLHLAEDGTVTVLTGKVEMGQGARAELTQAAAEELRVPPERIRLLMADTAAVPDDGTTAGSRTTPATVPAVRQAAAAARGVLTRLAARRWEVDPASVEVRDGILTHAASQRRFTFAELARGDETEAALRQAAPADVTVTPVSEWRVLGTPLPRPNRRDLVTGSHQYPSDLTRPGMLRGKVLRAPSYGARLVGIDPAPAQALPGVIVVRDGDFVGVAAPTLFQAEKAIEALAATARWESAPHPSSTEIYRVLRERVEGGVPANPFAAEVAAAPRALKAEYRVPYVQHAPMEPRAALAEWEDDRLTVWTGTQAPFGYVGELAGAFRMERSRVRVVVPDFGGGFGGKHTAEAAVEAARLARAARRPVLLRWSRAEEFTWAYFRPAALIEIEASLDAAGHLESWHFHNIASGASGIESPYRIPQSRSRHLPARAPVRTGSYRTLAATANVFARECFMDELAAAAGQDPLDFRLAHLEPGRLRAVLEAAAARFGWRERRRERRPGLGFGLACGTEKGSFVAGCLEVEVDPDDQSYAVRRITEVFECGAILNPSNLLAQTHSCIVMGLGPALREEMRFENGRIRNASFGRYLVPRFKDVPELDLHFLDRPDLPSVGAGETPILPVAPALANALHHATGRRLRSLPLRLADTPAA